LCNNLRAVSLQLIFQLNLFELNWIEFRNSYSNWIEFQFKLHATLSNVLIQMKFNVREIKSLSFITSLSLIIIVGDFGSLIAQILFHCCCGLHDWLVGPTNA
jgi:hypothetical protein